MSRSDVDVYVTEQADGPKRFAAHEDIRQGGGSVLGEIKWSDDPEELVAWARERAQCIWVRTNDGRAWWAGTGPVPQPDPDDELSRDDPTARRWPDGWTQ